MTLPRHVDWAKPEPSYKGIYDYTPDDIELTIGVGGYVDYDLPAGIINGIYRLLCSTDSLLPYQIEIYDREARTDPDDLVFRSVSTVGAYNSVTSQVGLILQADKDGASKVWTRVTGTAGEVYTLTFNLVRWR